MKHKLLNFVNEFNIWIYNETEHTLSNLDDGIFSFWSTGYESMIMFNERCIFHESDSDYKKMLEEVKLNLEAWKDLEFYLTKFFSKMTNEMIEEKYSLGIEEEKI